MTGKSEEKHIPEQLDVIEGNTSFLHDTNSHLAYGTYPFTTEFVQQKTLDESKIMPVSSIWKQGVEDLQTKPQITVVSKTKEPSPIDAGLMKCTSVQGFDCLQSKPKISTASDIMWNSSPRDARLVNSEDLCSLKKKGESFNSNAYHHNSPRMCGNYVKTWKSPPKFRGTPIGALYASRFSNKAASPPRQGQCSNSTPPSDSMYSSRFSDRVPSHSLISRSTFHGSRSTNNDYKHRVFSNDLIRGPRASGFKPSSNSPDTNTSYLYAQKDNFNKEDFEVNYEQAKFFMIKSFSEDDIHRCIKYNVWASTPHGNNKLDAAFRKADMEKMEKDKPCPVFLFFSVNSSGQFVGLAEMIGPVDFKKDMDFWQQNKWNGFFPVKWHIIKDIPNKIFYHITLENNYNRAVTYSRDTQEIYLPQGLSMLRIFKDYPCGTSILDDTEFYEKKEMEKERNISQHAGRGFDGSSVMHLESSFRNMSMSTRGVEPGDGSMYYPTSFASRQPFSNH